MPIRKTLIAAYRSLPPIFFAATKLLLEAALAFAGFGVVLLLLVLPFRSDFDASAVKNVEVPGSAADAPIRIMIRLTSFNEATNSAQISAVIIANRAITQKVLDGEASATIYLLDGEDYSGSAGIVKLVLDKSTVSYQLLAGETVPVQGTLVMYHKTRPYPFDDYRSSINVVVQGRGLPPDISSSLLKTVAGRTVKIEGDPNSFVVTLARPVFQQVFVVLSGLIFVGVIVGIALRLINSDAPENPVSQAFTVAGLLLGAAGFRDLLGLSKIASFSIADGYIVGIPLLVLAVAFFRTELVHNHRNTVKTPR